MTMSFYTAIRNDEHPCTWVFTDDEMHEGDWDDDDNFTPNPNFIEATKINMSNDNAEWVLGCLGFKVHEGQWEEPIDHFIKIGSAFLRSRIGQKSPEILPVTDNNWMSGGVPEGYLERSVFQLVQLAQISKARGANIIYGA